MAARPWEHADRAKAALRAIMDDPDLGVAALSSGRLAANVLEDLLPEAPRERAILVLAAQAGVAQALRDHVAHGLDDATAINLAVVSLEDNSPLDHDSCEWVVTQIAAAVGLVPTQPRAAEPVTRLVLPEGLQAAATVTAQAPPPTPPPPQPKRRKRRRVAVNCAAFSPAGNFLATAAAGDVARLWNVSSGTLERDITPGPAWHVAFSPDGKLVATAGGSTSQPAGVAAPAATGDCLPRQMATTSPGCGRSPPAGRCARRPQGQHATWRSVPTANCSRPPAAAGRRLRASRPPA